MTTTLRDFSTASRLSPGDQITMIDDEEQPKLRVIDPEHGKVKEIHIDGEPLTNYPGNENCDPESTAVLAVYENSLDLNINNWKEWKAEDIPKRLREFEDNWPDIEVPRYIIPEERIEPL